MMRDLRYAVRVLLKSPAFTATAVLTLALCIGANTAIFTVVDRVLLRPLPYPEPERLALIGTQFGRGNVEFGQAGVTWEALRAGVTSLDLATTSGGFGSTGVNLTVGDRPEYVKQQRVSAGYFRVLGLAPALGREFSAEEDRPGGPAAAMISAALWRRLFNSMNTAVGQSITLRGEPYTIVGVMPDRVTTGDAIDVWTPVRPCRTCEGGGENYEILARLKPAVTWAQAEAEAASATQAVMDGRYKTPGNPAHAHLVPLQRGETEPVRQPLVMLWSAVAVVLVIGCVNIAGLLLARGAWRAPEIGLRLALGGGRGAIVRQLLAESLVLAAAGGALGIALGYAGSQLSASLLTDAIGVTGRVGLDARVLAITAGIALATSVAFGLFPALQATRVDLRNTLIASGSGSIAGAARPWPRRLLVVTEVALGVVLLVGAGLLVRTFDYLTTLRAGFDGSHVTTATLSLQDARYRTTVSVNQLVDRSLARMHEIPGVQGAAVSLTLPYERALNTGGRWIGAAQGQDRIPIMNQTYVTPEYFETLRIPVVRGRVFTAADSATAAPVIVVNEAFVKRNSPDEDVIGRQIGSSGAPRTVVGVVGDIQQRAGWGNFGPVAAVPASYIPVAQTSDAFINMVHTWFSPSWFVRTAGPQQSIAADMQRAVQSVDPLLPFARFRTLDDVRAEAVVTQRAQATLFSALAALALLLAAIGLAGLVANAVTERTRELGIRLALGATSRQAIVSAAAPGVVLALAGVAIGLVGARFAATTLRHLVWGVSVGDPTTFVVAALVVFAVAVSASLIPALRIARLNPISALRQM